MSIDLTHATLAVGALGTAATGLVDTTKIIAGGMSRAGFGYIRELILRTVPQGSGGLAGTGLGTADVQQTLLANWINGMETGAQKAIARSFIKMHFNPTTAAALAAQTNVDASLLTAVAKKLTAMEPLLPAEADAYGRFDVGISALVDRAYERGDPVLSECLQGSGGRVCCGACDQPRIVPCRRCLVGKRSLSGSLPRPWLPLPKTLPTPSRRPPMLSAR